MKTSRLYRSTYKSNAASTFSHFQQHASILQPQALSFAAAMRRW